MLMLEVLVLVLVFVLLRLSLLVRLLSLVLLLGDNKQKKQYQPTQHDKLHGRGQEDSKNSEELNPESWVVRTKVGGGGYVAAGHPPLKQRR